MDEVGELAQISGLAIAALFAGAPRLHQQFGENSALVLTGEPATVLNVLMIGPENDPANILADGVGIARQRGHPLTTFFTAHVAASLIPHAERLGFTRLGEVPLMVLRPKTATIVPDACVVSRATDVATLERAIELRSQGRYPIDAVRRTVNPGTSTTQKVEIYVGSREGMAMSTVTATESGDTVGIWWMATGAKYQRKGVGRALLSHVINEYQRRGASRFYLIASKSGRPLYESLGFETIGVWTLWELDV
jgi:ribosomal protein S18 acetylase RimI-like enzyme